MMRPSTPLFIKHWCLPLLALLLTTACSKKETQEVPIGKAAQGTLYLDVYESGDVEAIKSINISSPNISWRYGSLKITHIVKDGSEVKTGDTVLVFDPAEVRKAIVEAEARVEMELAEMVKLKAQQQSDLESLKADYEVSRIAQEISRIQLESAGYEADIRKKEIELNLEKADIALVRAKEQIDNTIRIQNEEIKQKNLAIEQDRERLKEAYETLDMLMLKTPSPGIAIIARNGNSGNKFQVGDQTWTGFPLIQLPDLSKLKATVQINEVDIAKIRKGLQVEMKPDAFSDSLYKGEVISVANLAINKEGSNKIKVFPVEILIKGGGRHLLPGMTVSCRILVDKLENVLYVPLDAIMSDGVEEYVFKKTGSGYAKVVVETGASNTDYVVITKGLKEGDQVALTDPFAQPSKKDKKKAKS
jgi:HlyD family secretion protein